jgi:hypothetical protein
MIDEMTHTRADWSLFERRRRMRRLRMIVDLTANVLRHDASLNYRQARSLVDCARKSILELLPQYGEAFESTVRPGLDRILLERWPLEHHPYCVVSNELVN